MGTFIGINNSSISDGILEQVNINDKMGMHIGAFYEFNLSERIKFRPKVIFSQQGNRDREINGLRYIFHKSSYLNFPLNFKFFETTYILAGPQFGLLLHQEIFNTYSEGETFDFGVNLGFGQKIKSFFLEINFYQGLTKFKDKPNFDNNIGKGTNTLIQFSIGYYIF